MLSTANVDQGLTAISMWTATPPRASWRHPYHRDNALYDSFGQRIVTTMYTQSNQ